MVVSHNSSLDRLSILYSIDYNGLMAMLSGGSMCRAYRWGHAAGATSFPFAGSTHWELYNSAQLSLAGTLF